MQLDIGSDSPGQPSDPHILDNQRVRAGLDTDQAQGGKVMSREDNKAIVRRLIDEVISQGNFAVIDELLAPT